MGVGQFSQGCNFSVCLAVVCAQDLAPFARFSFQPVQKCSINIVLSFTYVEVIKAFHAVHCLH